MYPPVRTTPQYYHIPNQPSTVPQAPEVSKRTEPEHLVRPMHPQMMQAQANAARMSNTTAGSSAVPTTSRDKLFTPLPHQYNVTQYPQQQTGLVTSQQFSPGFYQPIPQAFAPDSGPAPYSGHFLHPAQVPHSPFLFDPNLTLTQPFTPPFMADEPQDPPQDSATPAAAPPSSAFERLDNLPDCRARYHLTHQSSLMWKFKFVSDDLKKNFDTLRSRLDNEYQNHCTNDEDRDAHKLLLDLLKEMDENGTGILAKDVMNDWAYVYQENYEPEYDWAKTDESKAEKSKKPRKAKKPGRGRVSK